MFKEEGIGWSLSVDASNETFPVHIGGECTSTEITKEEWQALVPIVIDLIDQFDRYNYNFVSDESIILQINKGFWSVFVEGFKDEWALKISLTGESLKSRGFNMYWPIPSAKDFVSAMRLMWDSYQ